MPDGSRSPCFFCAQIGHKRSAEHVWRDKWRQYYGDEVFEARHWGWEAQGTEAKSVDRKFRAKPFSQTLAEVCEPCNNGWMNAIENDVEELLLPLFRGERVRLGEGQTARLLLWAVKTAFVIAGTDAARGSAAVSQVQKDVLRAGAFPPGVSVWIFPLPHNAIVHHRTTPMGLPAQQGYGRFRLTSWDFMSVHFLVAHAPHPEIADTYLRLRWLLGRPAQERKGAWTCPGPAPTALIPNYHDGVLNGLADIVREAGGEMQVRDDLPEGDRLE